MSPGARNSRIYALENMLAATSSTIVSMASQLSEAEERERIFSGRGRWSHVRSLGDAKNLLNYLFNLLSSSRLLLFATVFFFLVDVIVEQSAYAVRSCKLLRKIWKVPGNEMMK